jgi:hypothetical protein
MTPKQRIVELQRSLRIAKLALEKIKDGTPNPYSVAELALDDMQTLAPKVQMQGLVGHEMIR